MAEQQQHHQSPWITYLYMLLWIVLSMGVILINKVILAYTQFVFPVTLTAIHMAFCSAAAFVLVRVGLANAVSIPKDVYFKSVVPIGGLFALTLWTSNAAYMYLEVSFIQMLKASAPMVVYFVGTVFQTEVLSTTRMANMTVVVAGVLVAAYGEIKFNLQGVLFQLCALLSESVRLTLIQLLLQSRGIRLNPIATLYHVAPCCLAFLTLPLLFLELRPLQEVIQDPNGSINWALLLLSAAMAFALNLSIFLLIGRSSALTLNVAGVVKDWLLIVLSVVMFRSPVTAIQILGYSLAFVGVAYYNYIKFHQAPSSLPTSSSKASEPAAGTGIGRAADASSAATPQQRHLTDKHEEMKPLLKP